MPLLINRNRQNIVFDRLAFNNRLYYYTSKVHKKENCVWVRLLLYALGCVSASYLIYGRIKIQRSTTCTAEFCKNTKMRQGTWANA